MKSYWPKVKIPEMYGFIAEINDCYVSRVNPPKVVPTCLFVVATKRILSLKKALSTLTWVAGTANTT